MVKKGIRDYVVDNLIFPKALIIDQPGLVYSLLAKGYWGKKEKRRVVFIFEELISFLQLETIKKIGLENSSLLWYRIGKDIAFRYLLLADIKKFLLFF